MLMLDLCSGLGGASRAMKDHGWTVICIDVNPDFKPDIVADIRHYVWDGGPVDLVWASPPCTEFSRESMPWCSTGKHPEMDIVKAVVGVIEAINPKWWIIENTRGAVRWFRPVLGVPIQHIGPYYLWGQYPLLGDVHITRGKQHYSGRNPARRSEIPYQLSDAVRRACEAMQ